MGSTGPADLFVGRVEELRQLEAARAAAAQGHGGLLVVAGDAGVGKTRLVTEFAARATAAGSRVLWGRCREIPGSPPYWPWSQALGGYLPGQDLALPQTDAAYLAHLAPALAGDGAPAPLAGEQDHFRLFDAVSRALRAAAARRPVVVILDDLHAADLPSLRLLQFLTPDLPGSAVLLLGTVRPPTDPAATDTASVLDAVLRPAGRIVLGGLSREETDALLAAWDSAPEVVTAVWEATGGNPFFTLETARLLAAEGRLGGLGAAGLSVPEGVRHTLRQRLAPLSDLAREVTETAAVVGTQFDAALLAAATGLPPDRVLQAVGEATALGVLAQPRIDLGTYRFAHALVRETIYGDLPGGRRAELHRRVAAALEARYGNDVRAHLRELADHVLRALPLSDPARAADLALRAGRAAFSEFAYDHAVRYLRAGLDLLAAQPAADPAGLAEGYLALGHALLRDGRSEDARTSFRRAAELAREHDLPTLLARAALGHGGQVVATGDHGDPAVVALLETAIDALPADEDDLGARLLARLAEEVHVTEPDRAAELTARALDRARRTARPEPLGRTLLARVRALHRPTPAVLLEERLALAREAVQTAERAGAAELELDARCLLVLELLEAGDVVAAEAQVTAFDRTARVLCQPTYRWVGEVVEAMRALMQGRYADAEAHADAAAAIGRAAPDGGGPAQHAVAVHTVQRLILARDRGDAVDTAGVTAALERHPHQPVWRAAAALRELAAGNAPSARVHYDVLRAGGFRVLRGPTGSLPALCLTAELAAGLRDGDGARDLTELLAPSPDGTPSSGRPPRPTWGWSTTTSASSPRPGATTRRPSPTSPAPSSTTARWVRRRGCAARRSSSPGRTWRPTTTRPPTGSWATRTGWRPTWRWRRSSPGSPTSPRPAGPPLPRALSPARRSSAARARCGR